MDRSRSGPVQNLRFFEATNTRARYTARALRDVCEQHRKAAYA